MAEKKEKGNDPEKTFRAGAVSATVWKNINKTKDGKEFENYSVTLKRGYKDNDGEWKDTNSFKAADIGKAKLVLSQAYECIVTKKVNDEVGQ